MESIIEVVTLIEQFIKKSNQYYDDFKRLQGTMIKRGIIR